MCMCIRVSSPLWIGCWYFLFSPPCLVFGAGGVVAELIPSEEPLWEKGEEPAETWTMLGGRLKKQGEGIGGRWRLALCTSSCWDKGCTHGMRMHCQRTGLGTSGLCVCAIFGFVASVWVGLFVLTTLPV